MQAEEWSLKIDQVSTNGKSCHFTLRGSVTGEDGEGVSTNRFVSKSGRIVIEPEDWNLGYCMQVFHRALPEGHTATWRSVLHGTDSAEPPPAQPGIERALTVAQGLGPGPHTLDLQAEQLQDLIVATRFYTPSKP